jgi:hypothetical protein
MTTDKPNVSQPISPPQRTVLAILAQWFDERSASRRTLAEEFRSDYPEDFPEQDIIAKTFGTCAAITWELAGGKPGAKPREHERFIKVSTADLATLIALADQRAPNAVELPNTTFDGEHVPCEPVAPTALSENIIERLAQAGRYARLCANPTPKLVTSWGATDPVERTMEVAGVKAVIAELAKEPVAFPTRDDVVVALGRGAGNAKDEATEVLALFRTRLGLMVVAKDAEIERLGKGTVYERKLYEEAIDNRPANEVTNAERQQYELTIEQQKQRIAELEKRLAAVAWAELPESANPKLLDSGEFDHFDVRGLYANSTREALLDTLVNTTHALRSVARQRDRMMALPDAIEALWNVRERIGNAPGESAEYYQGIVDEEVVKCGKGKRPAPGGRVFIGLTFERELPDGSRENVDPSTVRLVVGDDPTLLVPVGFGASTPR